MAHHHQRYAANARFSANQEAHFADEDDDDEEDDDDDSFTRGDNIRRSNYLHSVGLAAQQSSTGCATNQPRLVSAGAQGETIQVKLNESYFANEKRAVVNLVANCRQKLNSMQMFNPAKNQTFREQQQQQSSENVSLARDKQA